MIDKEGSRCQQHGQEHQILCPGSVPCVLSLESLAGLDFADFSSARLARNGAPRRDSTRHHLKVGRAAIQDFVAHLHMLNRQDSIRTASITTKSAAFLAELQNLQDVVRLSLTVTELR